ncbi:MAG TPA: Crp/Fnr family transcriptional regulator [Mucilaginibacter sp.]|jgi:CRP/FNR family transcriptional regulator
MSIENSRYLNVFSAFFEPQLLAEIEAKSMLMKVNRGDVILKIDQPVWGVPLVAEGTFKVSRLSDDCQELLLYYVKAGETCAMSFTSWMTTKVSSINGSAEEDSVIYIVPGKVADEWMANYDSWKQFVMKTILDGFTEVVRSIDDIAFKKTDERLVEYLKEKASINSSALINLTHQQIADELGKNRVVISRLLKKLETDGRILLYRNQIKLLSAM